MTFNTITINFDSKEEQILFENRARRIGLGALWERNTDELWTEWGINACTPDDLRELTREDDYTEEDIPEETYDRRGVEKDYDLDIGELDGVDIRCAEKIIGCEEGELDRFIYDFDDFDIKRNSEK